MNRLTAAAVIFMIDKRLRCASLAIVTVMDQQTAHFSGMIGDIELEVVSQICKAYQADGIRPTIIRQGDTSAIVALLSGNADWNAIWKVAPLAIAVSQSEAVTRFMRESLDMPAFETDNLPF